MFSKRNNKPTPITVFNDHSLYSAYIFKCSRVTGGKSFNDNIMGAPSSLFKPIVSKVQAGNKIFLWQIGERKLYGIWKAKTRGQYDPTAFSDSYGEYHAVVICDRPLCLERGIDENTLRGKFHLTVNIHLLELDTNRLRS